MGGGRSGSRCRWAQQPRRVTGGDLGSGTCNAKPHVCRSPHIPLPRERRPRLPPLRPPPARTGGTLQITGQRSRKPGSQASSSGSTGAWPSRRPGAPFASRPAPPRSRGVGKHSPAPVCLLTQPHCSQHLLVPERVVFVYLFTFCLSLLSYNRGDSQHLTAVDCALAVCVRHSQWDRPLPCRPCAPGRPCAHCRPRTHSSAWHRAET